jgi:hypothetical protein
MSSAKHYVLVDSRSRSTGTAWKYGVRLPSAMHDVLRAKLCWIEFFDASTRAAANAFAGTPYVSLHVEPFQGTHGFSTAERASSALAIIPRNFDTSTYAAHVNTCHALQGRIFKLEVAVFDAQGALMDLAGVEHAFMLEVDVECDKEGRAALPWGK